MTAPTLSPADRELLATLPDSVAALVAEGTIPIAAIRDVRAAAVREALEGVEALAEEWDEEFRREFPRVNPVEFYDDRAHALRAALRGAVDAAGGDGGA